MTTTFDQRPRCGQCGLRSDELKPIEGITYLEHLPVTVMTCPSCISKRQQPSTCKKCGFKRIYDLGLCAICYGNEASGLVDNILGKPCPETPPFEEPEGFSFAD